MKIITSISLVYFFATVCYSQIVIGKKAIIAGSAEAPVMAMQISGDLINNSTYDFSKARIILTLTGTVEQKIRGNWTVEKLTIQGGGLKSLTGTGTANDTSSNLVVTKELNFDNGIFHPTLGKLLFIGPEDGIIVNTDATSYVDGIFVSSGKGRRLFPVGNSSGTYAPLIFNTVDQDGEIGVQFFEADPKLRESDPQIDGLFNTRYWHIVPQGNFDIATINSQVSLSLNGISVPADATPLVVQANDNISIPDRPLLNLGSADSGNDAEFVLSGKPVTQPLVAIGYGSEIKVTIRELITPYLVDQVNDGLYVRNIEKFPYKKIVLMDRWGVKVKEWGSEYTNDVAYDFSRLTPGNYICVAEYGADEHHTETTSQMVTVLKTK